MNGALMGEIKISLGEGADLKVVFFVYPRSEFAQDLIFLDVLESSFGLLALFDNG